jgi:hypothetical protein
MTQMPRVSPGLLLLVSGGLATRLVPAPVTRAARFIVGLTAASTAAADLYHGSRSPYELVTPRRGPR